MTGTLYSPATNRGRQQLYVTGTSVGNGADLTEDILQVYTLPANTLQNVGDILHIVAGGTFIPGADAKSARIRLGGISGTVLANPASTSTSSIWAVDVYVVKTAANAQSYIEIGSMSVGVTAKSGTATQTDTGALDIVVTGTNTSNSVANSITCQFFIVEILHAGQ